MWAFFFSFSLFFFLAFQHLHSISQNIKNRFLQLQGLINLALKLLLSSPPRLEREQHRQLPCDFSPENCEDRAPTTSISSIRRARGRDPTGDYFIPLCALATAVYHLITAAWRAGTCASRIGWRPRRRGGTAPGGWCSGRQGPTSSSWAAAAWRHRPRHRRRSRWTRTSRR